MEKSILVILYINATNQAHLYSVVQWPTEKGNSIQSFPSSLSLVRHTTMNSDWPIRKKIVPSLEYIYLTAMDTLPLNCSLSYVKQRKSNPGKLWNKELSVIENTTEISSRGSITPEVKNWTDWKMKSLQPALFFIPEKKKSTCTFIHIFEVIWRLLQIKFRAVDWFLFLAEFIGLGFQPDYGFMPANLIITSAFMLILTFLSWCKGTLVENFR